MPELPDIELYLHALRPRIVGRRLERIRLASPFLVRSFEPPLDHVNGKTVKGLRRLGKRLVWEMDDDLFLVVPTDAVEAVHSQKVILNRDKLDPGMLEAINHAHDAEIRGL